MQNDTSMPMTPEEQDFEILVATKQKLNLSQCTASPEPPRGRPKQNTRPKHRISLPRSESPTRGPNKRLRPSGNGDPLGVTVGPDGADVELVADPDDLPHRERAEQEVAQFPVSPFFDHGERERKARHEEAVSAVLELLEQDEESSRELRRQLGHSYNGHIVDPEMDDGGMDELAEALASTWL
uniref:Uncharacterized protein n=1 Tax=Mycena chlorophos TaxID=658473 RepID=A0ABQ0LR10_MYCCL|nr:predicted protein [Mycena chlorophos]